MVKKFGLNMEEFSQITGYSRQYLYQMLNKEVNVPERTLEIIVTNLQIYANKIYREELETINQKNTERQEAIKELRDHLTGELYKSRNQS